MDKYLDLTIRSNWSRQLTYVHRRALLIGVVLGFMLGFVVTAIFVIIIQVILWL